MTIHSRKHPVNMAPWLAEKSESACWEASRLADLIREAELSPEVREELELCLHPLLYELTKIVEYSYDTEHDAWDHNLAQRILEQGSTAYNFFLCRIHEFSDYQVFKLWKLGNGNPLQEDLI